MWQNSFDGLTHFYTVTQIAQRTLFAMDNEMKNGCKIITQKNITNKLSHTFWWNVGNIIRFSYK